MPDTPESPQQQVEQMASTLPESARAIFLAMAQELLRQKLKEAVKPKPAA